MRSTWTLFLLAAQPELQEELAAEAQAALADGVETTLADRLPRLRLFLEESLRLYPPVPRFDRQAIGPDRLGDAEVEAGDIVSIWPWLLHRHTQAVGRSRRVRHRPLRRRRAAATASNICRSAPARGPASARSSRRPRR